MGDVPLELAGAGTQLDDQLPDEYAEWPGEPVVAEVADMPFRPSAHPSARVRPAETPAGRDITRVASRPANAHNVFDRR